MLADPFRKKGHLVCWLGAKTPPITEILQTFDIIDLMLAQNTPFGLLPTA
jgi:hypothetical protein